MSPTYSGPTASQLASQPLSAPDSLGTSADAVVENTVRSMLAGSPLRETAYITVAARNGVVTLDGTVSDGLLLARFKNQVTSALPSVTIEDRLDWVVPECGIGVA